MNVMTTTRFWGEAADREAAAQLGLIFRHPRPERVQSRSVPFFGVTLFEGDAD